MKLRDIFRKNKKVSADHLNEKETQTQRRRTKNQREQTEQSDQHSLSESVVNLNESDGWGFASDFISYPQVTEKSGALEKWRQYVFKVKARAKKIQIRQAIEKLYRVQVEKVRLINLPAKKTKLGRWEGEKPGMRKAIVKLKPGYKIESTNS